MTELEGDLTNTQISEAVRQATEINLQSGSAVGQAITYQLLAQSVGQAMQNAVAQQQRAYMLRNAAVTVATKALLEAGPGEAIKLIDPASGESVDRLLENLDKLMKRVEAMRPERPAGTAKAGAPSAGKTKKKAAGRRARG